MFDLDGCDPSREFLCTRRPVGFIGAAIGVEALLAGLALEFANPPTAADDAAARRCRDVPPGEACPTQRGSHPLYGDVSPDAFFADGAAASRTFSDVALSSSLALGAGFTLLWGRRYAAAFASSVGYTLYSTELLKRWVGNPRPIAWMTTRAVDRAFAPDPSDTPGERAEKREARADAIERQRRGSTYRSFVSGHTSMTAAATFSVATMLFYDFAELEGRTGRSLPMTVCAVACFGAAVGLTVGVGAARVTGGAHHIPDVVVGGLLGAAFGVLVPLVVLAPSDSIPVADGIRVSELSLGFSGGQASLNGLWF